MTQNEMLIRWLTPTGRSITPMQALRKFNCWSLSSRTSEIKKKGYPIQSELIRDKKTGKTYAKYYFK
jgi:Helix-turn-helix domain